MVVNRADCDLYTAARDYFWGGLRAAFSKVKALLYKSFVTRLTFHVQSNLLRLYSSLVQSWLRGRDLKHRRTEDDLRVVQATLNIAATNEDIGLAHSDIGNGGGNG